MKQLIFILFGLIFVIPTYSQAVINPKLKLHAYSRKSPVMLDDQTISKHSMVNDFYHPKKPGSTIKNYNKPVDKNGSKFVSIIDIGTSANAYSYGYDGGQRSILAYNADINTVTHFHRMGGNLDPGGYSGDLGYDVSTDGGMTFTNMVECYVCTENGGGQYYTDAARYPNHGIYNPEGNTDPANAFVSFFVPTLDGSNSPDSWGGYGYGVSSIGDPTYTTKNLVSSDPGANIYHYIPDGFTITNTGEVWVTDINQDWTTGDLNYTGYLLVSHGVWNDDIDDFEYEEFLLDCPVYYELDRPAMAKIEFSPDGLTGYIMALSDNGELDFSLGTYFPIIWKTIDGGETWNGPIEVELAGPDGIEAIMYYLTEEEWQSFWQSPYPERDEVRYTCAFDFDLTVDGNGNPHIGVGVGIASISNYTIHSKYPYYAITDIWSPDGGDTWDAFIIDRPKQFRSNFDPNFTEDNRVQIARDHAGDYIFVSYMDTHLEGEEYNDYPDIMCRGINVNSNTMTVANTQGIIYNGATNATYLSDGMGQAYFMVMANEVIDVDADSDEFIIPFSYEELNIVNVGDPVQYKYIQDFSFSEDDFYTFGEPDIDLNPDNLIINNIETKQTKITSDDFNQKTQTYDTLFTIFNRGTEPLQVQAVSSGSSWLGVSGFPSVPFTLDALDSQTVEITINWNMVGQTTQTGTISIASNDPDEPTVIVTVTVNFNPSQHFTPVWAGGALNPMTITVKKAMIETNDLQVGDEIGVFDGDACVGAAEITEIINPSNSNTYVYITCSKDDPDTPEIDGYTVGNNISYRLWDASEQSECQNTEVTFPYAPNYQFTTFVENETAIVQLTGQTIITQDISLSTGWNMLSYNVMPENMDLMTVMDDLITANTLVKVFNEQGTIMQEFPWGWVNNIGDMSNTEGYYTRVNSTALHQVSGYPVTLPFAIPLFSGWNIMGYPCQNAQDALTVLQPLINSEVLIKVIDESGNIIQQLPFGWVNNIGNLNPGEGYLIKVSSSTTLNLTEGSKNIATMQSKKNPQFFVPEVQGNPYMPSTFVLEHNLTGENLEVGIFIDDICVDACVVEGRYLYFSVTTDEELLFIGKSPEFKVYNSTNGNISVPDVECIYGNPTVAPLETTILKTKESTGIDDLNVFSSLKLYPNPAQTNVCIDVVSKKPIDVDIIMESIDGAAVHSIKNVSLVEGSNKITMDIAQYPKGVYQVRILYNNGFSLRKMLVIQ